MQYRYVGAVAKKCPVGKSRHGVVRSHQVQFALKPLSFGPVPDIAVYNTVVVYLAHRGFDLYIKVAAILSF
jgi:hypothetical protein